MSYICVVLVLPVQLLCLNLKHSLNLIYVAVWARTFIYVHAISAYYF